MELSQRFPNTSTQLLQNLAINVCKRRTFHLAARNACNNGNSYMRDTGHFLYMWHRGVAGVNCDD